MAGIEFSGFDWDDGNRSKCQKHGLTIADVEHVLVQCEAVIAPVEPYLEARLVAIGRTSAGRHAFVVFTTREKGRRASATPDQCSLHASPGGEKI